MRVESSSKITDTAYNIHTRHTQFRNGLNNDEMDDTKTKVGAQLIIARRKSCRNRPIYLDPLDVLRLHPSIPISHVIVQPCAVTP
jgi:hypothetical protein